MSIRNGLQYGTPQQPFYIEYNRRKGHYSMSVNHMHSHCELYYLFSGERYYFIEDRAYTVKAGDLVIIPGDVLHKTSDTGIPNHERIVLYYNESFFRHYSREEAELLLSPFRDPRRLLRLDSPDKLQMEQLLYGMLRGIQDRQPGYDISARHAAAEALLFTARQLLGSDQEPDKEEPSPTEAKITEVARYINAHFREPMTLDALSGEFYLSPSYLSRTFKKFTGFGLAEYVGITRIKEAQRLLRESDKRITDISEEVGFGSFAHFEKVFKELNRLSPRSYRAQFRSKAGRSGE